MLHFNNFTALMYFIPFVLFLVGTCVFVRSKNVNMIKSHGRIIFWLYFLIILFFVWATVPFLLTLL